MKVRLMILGGLIAIGCAWVGYIQFDATGDEQQVGSVDSPSEQPEPEKVDSGIVTASYESSDASPAVRTIIEADNDSLRTASYKSSDAAPAVPAISIQIQMVEFQDQPMVDTALEQLWGDIAASPSSTGNAPPLARSRIVATKEISATLNSLASQGMALVRAGTPRSLPDGRSSQWTDAVKWEVTPTIRAKDLIDVSLAGELWKRSASGNALVWKITTAAELRPGETLVVEGQESHGFNTEISRIPLLGDIPLVGPLVFSKKTTRKETHKSLYLITAEAPKP